MSDATKPQPTIAEVAAKAKENISGLTANELLSVKRFQELQEQIRKDIQSALGDRRLYSRSELAEVFDVTIRTINRWSAGGEIPKSRDGKWDIREVVRCLMQRMETARTQNNPEDRYHQAKAAREERRLAKEDGVLVERASVIRAAGPVLVNLRAIILGLPDRLVHHVPEEQRGDVRADITKSCESTLKELQEVLIHAGAVVAPTDAK